MEVHTPELGGRLACGDLPIDPGVHGDPAAEKLEAPTASVLNQVGFPRRKERQGGRAGPIEAVRLERRPEISFGASARMKPHSPTNLPLGYGAGEGEAPTNPLPHSVTHPASGLRPRPGTRIPTACQPRPKLWATSLDHWREASRSVAVAVLLIHFATGILKPVRPRLVAAGGSGVDGAPASARLPAPLARRGMIGAMRFKIG